MKRTRIVSLLVVALAALAPARGDGQPDPLDALARELVEKRAAVERLSSEVELKKAAERELLRSAAQQRSDVERQLKALEHELEELDRAVKERAGVVDAREAARRALKPLVVRHLDALGAHVRSALPFRVEERAAALDDLKREVEADRVSPDQALTRLWSALEDELRLTRDTGLYRQQLELEGKTQLVDVAKLGMVLLYVRTLDGRFGWLLPDDAGAWHVVLATDPADRRRLAALFESLDKHIRQGLFELPNPYAGQTPAGS